MRRLLFDDLLVWKNTVGKKPLLLQGARQVGKTYLVNEFGKKAYQNYIYLNFELDPELEKLFKGKLDPHRIVEDIGLYYGKKINIKNTLIFFDEVQVLPRAITSLKYFQEDKSDFHIIAAGSLLGVSIGKSSSFPVGKVNFMRLHPLNFIEYLMAIEEDVLVDLLLGINRESSISDIIHNKLSDLYKMYLFLGGMPEVVQSYINNNDIAKVRKLQNDILESYMNDFSKYADNIQSVKNAEVWNSIPYQLGRENKKFKYSSVRKKGRANMYDQSIEWLKQAGLIHIVYNVSTPKLPLGGYADQSKFKIYLLDSGLLGAMLKLSSRIIIDKTALFTEYNGAFIENYVAATLSKNIDTLYYWTSKSDAEVDFLIAKENEIVPLEVKSGSNRNLKSLQSYAFKYSPRLICRTSPRNLIRADNFVNIPLYAIGSYDKLLEEASCDKSISTK